MTNASPAARLPLRGRLAAVVRDRDAWRVVVYRAGGGGPAPGVVERTQSIPVADVSGLAAALTRARVGAIVRVVPSERIVVRVVNAPAPAGDATQVAAALGLLAEAQLGGSFPAHRRGAMALPASGSGVAGATIVALGWSGEGAGGPGSDPLDGESFRKIAPHVFAPAPAALVAVAVTAKAAWAVNIDRASGVVAVCGLSGAEGRKPALRVARDDPDDAATWSTFVAAQAALVGGPTDGPLSSDTASLALAPGAAFAAALQASTDASWLSDFGLALGAAMCATSPSPSWHGVCTMLASPPVPYRPIVVRAADALALPRRAWPLLAACAALVLLGPWGLAWARHSILKSLAAESGEDDAESITAQKQAEHYQLLKDRRWPMTKLLADLTGAMPPGITLETLTLEYGQPVRVTGAADSPNLVSEWRSALDKSKVFADVRAPSVEASRFELTARVAQPFGANSVLVAKPTTGGSGVAASVSTPAPRAAAPVAGGGTGGARGGRTGSAAGSTGGAQPAAAAAKPPTIPPALTDAQIEAMDLSTATVEFGKRKGAAGRPGVSEADKARLTAEAEKLQTRRKALQGSAGGGS